MNRWKLMAPPSISSTIVWTSWALPMAALPGQGPGHGESFPRGEPHCPLALPRRAATLAPHKIFARSERMASPPPTSEHAIDTGIRYIGAVFAMFDPLRFRAWPNSASPLPSCASCSSSATTRRDGG